LAANTLMNKHSRYLLQAYPFIFLFIGRLAEMGSTPLARVSRYVSVLAVTLNVASILIVHPFYLTYFNEPSGGPRQGYKHLIDSNIDWGQGLVSLKQWLHDTHREDDIQLAYFGAVDPEVYGIHFSLPGILDDQSPLGRPRPGIHVISVNYVAGSGVSVLAPSGQRQQIPSKAFLFYQQLVPKDSIANCFNVYELSVADVKELKATTNP